MKKIFALVLAVAMVLSLASVALAANTKIGTKANIVLIDGSKKITVDNNIYTSAKKAAALDASGDVTGAIVEYGKTAYIPFVDDAGNPVKESDAVSALKVSAKWTENGKYIKSVEILKKEGAYMIAIKTTGSETGSKDVEGTITLSGKAYDSATPTDKKVKADKTEIDVILTLQYPKITTTGTDVNDDGQLWNFEDQDDLQDEEFELTFEEAEDVTFTVDTTHQKDLVLKMDTDEDEAVEKANPNANMDFFNFYGATFKKTGELFIPADEGSYIYEIVDGALKTVNATYDDFDEGFTIKTKTLGYYVVSDIPLNAAATVAPAAEAAATPAAANPSTGAAL